MYIKIETDLFLVGVIFLWVIDGLVFFYYLIMRNYYFNVIEDFRLKEVVNKNYYEKIYFYSIIINVR